MHNFKSQSMTGKIVLILTYPFAIGVHWVEWRRMRKLKRIVRNHIGDACEDPQGVTAEIVNEASSELRYIYGK